MPKYDKKDFELIIEKRKTRKEIAKKYGTTEEAIRKAMNRHGYYLSKRKIIIYSPYLLKECASINDAAKELGVSNTTIINALKGKKVKILEELDVQITEEKKDEYHI